MFFLGEGRGRGCARNHTAGPFHRDWRSCCPSYLATPIVPSVTVCNFRPHRSVRDEGSANQRTSPALVSRWRSRARYFVRRGAATPREQGSAGKRAAAAFLKFPPDYIAVKSCNRQTASSGWCSLRLDQYLPSPRPSGGSLVIIGPGTGCQGQWLFSGPLRRWNQIVAHLPIGVTCPSAS